MVDFGSAHENSERPRRVIELLYFAWEIRQADRASELKAYERGGSFLRPSMKA